MLEDLKDLFVTSKLYLTLYFITAFYISILLLTMTPFPLNYGLMWLPYLPALYLAVKEEMRKTRLGFAHDTVREISQERMQKALEDIERELKKTKPLP